MADYSYAKVDFWLPTPEEAEDFAWNHMTDRPGEGLKLTVPNHQDGEVTVTVIPGGSGFEAEFEEARYGFACDDEVVSLCRWLIRLGVAWSAYDGGGYEWPEAQHEWHPGDGNRLHSRELSFGQPVLPESAWRRAIDISDGDPDALVRIVDGHFGADHHGWLRTAASAEEGAA